MRLLRLLTAAVTLTLFAPAISAQSAVTPQDFEALVGPGWTGTLTYRDNDCPARIRMVYTIGTRAASLQKLVRYQGAEYFERHIYEWTR